MKVEGDWERDGYVVFRGAYSAETVAELLAVAEHCWECYETDPHGLQAPRAADTSTVDDHCMRHLNHPGYLTPGSRGFRTLMEAVAEPAVLEHLGQMFGCEPLFRSTSLFVNPRGTSTEGSWHRDSQFLVPNEDEERQALHDMKTNGLLHARGCQMQVALVPSDDVELVKGSHLRWDSPAEYAVRRANGGRNSTGVMPNSTRIALQPGDAVCFNSWGYHRGRYHTDKCRRTLMFTYTGAPFSTFDYFSDQPWILGVSIQLFNPYNTPKIFSFGHHHKFWFTYIQSGCMQEHYLEGLTPGCQAFFRAYIKTFGDRKLFRPAMSPHEEYNLQYSSDRVLLRTEN